MLFLLDVRLPMWRMCIIRVWMKEEEDKEEHVIQRGRTVCAT